LGDERAIRKRKTVPRLQRGEEKRRETPPRFVPLSRERPPLRRKRNPFTAEEERRRKPQSRTTLERRKKQPRRTYVDAPKGNHRKRMRGASPVRSYGGKKRGRGRKHLLLFILESEKRKRTNTGASQSRMLLQDGRGGSIVKTTPLPERKEKKNRNGLDFRWRRKKKKDQEALDKN